MRKQPTPSAFALELRRLVRAVGDDRKEIISALFEQKRSPAEIDALMCCVLMGTRDIDVKTALLCGACGDHSPWAHTGHGMSRYAVAACSPHMFPMLDPAWVTPWSKSKKSGWGHQDALEHHAQVGGLLEQVVSSDVFRIWTKRCAHVEQRVAELARSWVGQATHHGMASKAVGSVFARLVHEHAPDSVLEMLWSDVDRMGGCGHAVVALAQFSRDGQSFGAHKRWWANPKDMNSAFSILFQHGMSLEHNAEALVAGIFIVENTPTNILTAHPELMAHCGRVWAQAMQHSLSSVGYRIPGAAEQHAVISNLWRPEFGQAAVDFCVHEHAVRAHRHEPGRGPFRQVLEEAQARVDAHALTTAVGDASDQGGRRLRM